MSLTANEILFTLLTPGLRVALVLLVAFLANRFALILVQKIIEYLVRTRKNTARQDTAFHEKRIATLKKAFGSIFSVIIWLLAVLTMLPVFGINVVPVLAGLGVGGLALGLAAQSVIKDYIAGIFILLEDQFRVGEKVEVAGKTGLVEDFSLRRTVLRSEDNSLVYVPNSQIKVTSNLKRRNKEK